MRPHKPSKRLKPERVQVRLLAIGKSLIARVSAALEWIEAAVRRLRSFLGRNDNDPS